MRRFIPGLTFALTTVFVLLMTSPVLAQAQQQQQSAETSVFKMFFAPIQPRMDFLDWLGVFMIWMLIALSGLSVGLIIHMAMKNRRTAILPPPTFDTLNQLMNEKKYREAIEYANADPSYLGQVVAAGLNEAANGYGAMERAIEETSDNETTRVLRPIEYLNVLGNIAPMLGLFGTVYGIIVAFARLVAAGGRPDPAALAGGISTALVTTFWGLIIAMPALAAYSTIRNKIDEYTTEGLLLAEDLIKPFKPGAKTTPAKPGSSTGAATGAPGAGGDKDKARPMATPKPETARA
ncbi:MAG: MotA/TolQ/ExbB proton channel family protein [Phycisphaeraceae bacterium]